MIFLLSRKQARGSRRAARPPQTPPAPSKTSEGFEEGRTPSPNPLIYGYRRRSGDRDVVLAAVGIPPGLRAVGQHGVERLDVLHAAILQPALQRADTFPGVDRDRVLPGGTAAEHAGEAGAGLGGQLQRLAEDIVAHAGA